MPQAPFTEKTTPVPTASSIRGFFIKQKTAEKQCTSLR